MRTQVLPTQMTQVYARDAYMEISLKPMAFVTKCHRYKLHKNTHYNELVEQKLIQLLVHLIGLGLNLLNWIDSLTNNFNFSLVQIPLACSH